MPALRPQDGRVIVEYTRHTHAAPSLLAVLLFLAPIASPGRGAEGPGRPTPGRIAYQSLVDGRLEIYVMDSDGGRQARLTDNEANDSNPRWSPDGRRIVFVSYRDGNSEIYLMDADGSNQTRLTDHPAEDYNPAWSPDGSMIAYNTDRFDDGGTEILRQNVEGTWGWNLTRLTHSPTADDFLSWSPDGRWIAFESDRDRDDPEIYLTNAVDGTNLQRLTFTRALDEVPSWSPDSRQILFSSDRLGEPQNGDYEIFIMDLDGGNVRQITAAPGQDTYPSMSPDGRMIVFESYRDGHAEIYRINSDGSGELRLTHYEGVVDDGDEAPAGNGNPSWSPAVPE